MRRTPRQHGFTLLEVMAVVFLTAVVMGVALDFFVDVSRNTNRAAEDTRQLRRAVAILDRVARDFERTMLLQKEADQDPITHPWLFVGESTTSSLGADRVIFVALSGTARGADAGRGDLSRVAYFTRPAPEGGLELVRWSEPGLPESLDKNFPLPDDPGVLLLADGIADFGVRFRAEAGEATDAWDSTTVAQSGQLPQAVEIRIQMALPEDELPADDFGADPDGPAAGGPTFARTVLLPLKPFAPAIFTGEEPPAGTNTGPGAEELEELLDENPALRRVLDQYR